MMRGKIKGTNCAIRKNIVKGVERDKKPEKIIWIIKNGFKTYKTSVLYTPIKALHISRTRGRHLVP